MTRSARSDARLSAELTFQRLCLDLCLGTFRTADDVLGDSLTNTTFEQVDRLSSRFQLSVSSLSTHSFDSFDGIDLAAACFATWDRLVDIVPPLLHEIKPSLSCNSRKLAVILFGFPLETLQEDLCYLCVVRRRHGDCKSERNIIDLPERIKLTTRLDR